MKYLHIDAWIKVVTQPLGLVGFVVFLVFLLALSVKQIRERRWLFAAAVIVAMIALVGGLGVAYRQISVATPPVPPSPAQQPSNSVEQNTTGQGSPAVQGVHGDVNISVDQSNGKSEAKKPAASGQTSQQQSK